MPSLIELIFSVQGSQQAAAAAKDVESAYANLEKRVTSAEAQGFGKFRDGIAATSASLRESLIPNVDESAKQLIALGAAAISVREVYKGFKDALGTGAELQQLSLRTQESVRNLVIEETAFKNAGLSAGYLGTAINLMDRALAPNAANAKRNAQIFHELGISIDEIRTEDALGRLRMLSDAFARLPDQSERARIAMQLFGRYSGGQMLQLFGDPKALGLAEEQAGRLADRLQADAAQFRQVEEHLNVINLRFKEMFVAGAEQVLPVLEEIAHVAGSINLSGLGTILGTAGPAGLGSVAAIWGIDRLDLALLNTAERFDGYMTGSIARVAAKATNVLAAAMPIGLGIAVAGELVAGIAQARASAEWQQLVADISAARQLKGETQKQLAGITTSAEAGDTANSMRARLADLQTQRDALQKEMALAGPGPRSVEDVANQGTVSGTFASSIAKFLGGSSYIGSDGKQRDFPADQSSLLKLNQEITTLQSAIEKISTPSGVGSTIAANNLAALRSQLAPLVAQLPELRQKSDELNLKAENPLNRVIDLGNRRRSLEAQLAQSPAEGLSADEIEAQRLKIKTEIAKITEEEHAAGQKVAEDLKRSADEAQRRHIFELQTQQEVAAAAGDDQKAAQLKKQIELERSAYELHGADLTLMQQRIEAEDRITQAQIARKKATESMASERVQLENSLNAIRENLANLEADYGRTEAEKWTAKRLELLQEVNLLENQIAADEKAADQARALNEPAAAAIYDQSAAAKGQQLAGLRGQAGRLGPDPNNPFEQMRASLTALRNEWGTTSQQIGNDLRSVIGGGMSSINQNLTTAIVRTGDWRQAWANIRLAISEQVVGALIEMGERYVATKLIMAATDKSLAAANLAAMIPMATAQTMIWAPAATMATIASWGGAAAAAPFEIEAAMGLTSAMALIPGHAGGGMVTGGRQLSWLNEEGNEFIFSAPAVRNIGQENLQAMHEAASRGAPIAPPSGVGQSGTAAGSRIPNVHLYFDRALFMAAMRSDMEGVAHEVYDKRTRNN